MNVQTERNLGALRPIAIAIGVVAVLLTLQAIVRNASDRPYSAPSAAPAASYSDAQIKSIMEGNIAAWSGQSWYPAIHLNGATPDIAVTDRVLIVATLLNLTDSATASSICRTILASAHDPDTAASLGVRSVVIISGGQKITDCRP